MGYMYAILASALWGLTYALDERMLKDLAPLKLYFLHSLFGLCLSAVLWVLTGGRLMQLLSPSFAGEGGKLLVCTLVAGAFGGIAIVSSIGSLGASTAAILEISYPLFVVAFSCILFAQGVNGRVLIGGACIFLGAALIVAQGGAE